MNEQMMRQQPGTAPLFVAATRVRRLFGSFERRQLFVFGFPVLLLALASRDWRLNLLGLVLGFLLLPILKYTGEHYPFLLDDLFGYWLFESLYTDDAEPNGAAPRIFKGQ